jgi:single-stranded DNA-binding protein
VVLFGPLAEYARTLTKGSLVLVQGAVRSREYEKDGVKHRVFEVRAETIGKLDRSERQEVGVTNHNLFPGHSRGNFRLIFRVVLR